MQIHGLRYGECGTPVISDQAGIALGLSIIWTDTGTVLEGQVVRTIERHQPLPLCPVGMDSFLLDAVPTFTQRLGLNCVRHALLESCLL